MKISNIVATVKLAAPLDIGYLNQKREEIHQSR
jgi:TATA-box binding protein (TBP) (component of TFIID and TFIIIB)